jgi:hypothetical protein
MQPPTWEHRCDTCVFLGTGFKVPSFDLYWCVDGPKVRYSDEANAYLTPSGVWWTDTEIEAFDRAVAEGLVSDEMCSRWTDLLGVGVVR